ncbi:serine hydrolase [Pleionea sp. CnH1-48]|uniref:serine hydrolase domain-containing protein n=1 Tax=Pleionea sp. CnH1-48 TaxID=2954494 RepID=UPI0020979AF7|nr:serine hydrolase domain-containing protein [Pleionea sp. CnH1-48]MCO7225129.1 beta-lactamase family protein [Pleionea sp. CnH1-48]
MSYLIRSTLLFSLFILSSIPLTAKDDLASKNTSTDELHRFIQQRADNDQFSGAVLLANKEEVLYQSAFGLASKRYLIPNNVQTKFNLASMNKMFTAVAIMQLIEKGKLTLTSSLVEFIDESWLPKEVSEKIEIQHLLSHTSGLGSYFNKSFIHSARERYRTLNDYRNLVQNETLRFKPGTDYHYSNTGMLMLGIVIEKISNKDYDTYIKENIYDRAGMLNTGSYDMDQPVPNLAMGYLPANNHTGWKNNLFMHVIKGGPAGGGFSTIEDLHRFAVALTTYKLLGKEATEQLYSAKPKLNSKKYGYGFRIKNNDENRIVGHDGAFPGIDSNLDIHLDNGYISVVLSNYGRTSKPIIEKINELIYL